MTMVTYDLIHMPRQTRHNNVVINFFNEMNHI